MERYALTVPKIHNDGTPVDQALLQGVMTTLTDLFGGCTLIDVEGAWQGARLYVEPGIRFEVDTDNPEAAALLTAIAGFLGDALAQECVYLTRQAIDAWLVAPSHVIEEA